MVTHWKEIACPRFGTGLGLSFQLVELHSQGDLNFLIDLYIVIGIRY
jgi:hypothetical protein